MFLSLSFCATCMWILLVRDTIFEVNRPPLLLGTGCKRKSWQKGMETKQFSSRRKTRTFQHKNEIKIIWSRGTEYRRERHKFSEILLFFFFKNLQGFPIHQYNILKVIHQRGSLHDTQLLKEKKTTTRTEYK